MRIGWCILDRFRDLERAGETGRKDAALLAAIAGFETLSHPTSFDLRQFCDLFTGLFALAREDTRRTASAALSRLDNLPDEVAETIADQPIRISAPFLAFSPCLTDLILLKVIAHHGISHARAVSRRVALSPVVVDLLAQMGDAVVTRSLRIRYPDAVVGDAATKNPTEETQIHDDQALREQIRAMALRRKNTLVKPAPHSTASDIQASSNLVESATSFEPNAFAELLATALSADQMLAERIMLDVSGCQLTMALQALELQDKDILNILMGIFPQLRKMSGGLSHAQLLVNACDRKQSKQRVEAWVRANNRVAKKPELAPYSVETADRIDRRAPNRVVEQQYNSPGADIKKA